MVDQQALELYGVRNWGKGYFAINDKGNVVVHPNKKPEEAIDLKELVDQLQERGIQLPILLRFTDILRHRVGEIYEASNGNAIQLAGLYNRATWVILVALLPLAVLAGFGYGVLLVAGAIGGLVSRMQRLVFSTRIPITYGSSWAPDPDAHHAA